MRTLSKITKYGMGLLLLTGATLRILWGYGGPQWSYWLGNLMFGTFLIIPGITIMLAPRFGILWVQYLGSKNGREKIASWDELRPVQKLVIYASALMELIIGVVILLVNLSQVVNR